MPPRRKRPLNPPQPNNSAPAVRGSLTRISQTTKAELFSGPLPPPQALAEYNQIVPNGAERIFAMAEAQSRHRMGLESYVVKSESVRANWGLAAGFMVSLLFLAGAVTLSVLGYPTQGVILGSIDIGVLAGVFVYGSETRRRERKERVDTLAGKR